MEPDELCGPGGLDRYVSALNAVIARHDILRTAIVWEGLPEPVQVVWRHAPIVAEEIDLDPQAGDIAEQLKQRFHPRHYRLDVRCAPLLRLFIAHDPSQGRWVMMQLLASSVWGPRDVGGDAGRDRCASCGAR